MKARTAVRRGEKNSLLSNSKLGSEVASSREGEGKRKSAKTIEGMVRLQLPPPDLSWQGNNAVLVSVG